MRTNDLHIELPMSKSLSNRWLMINHIMGDRLLLRKLSTADDTRLLALLLRQLRRDSVTHFNCQNAGTVARFMLALLAVTPGLWTLDGDDRMRQRPMGPLIDALRGMGCTIRCTQREGFLPVEIAGAMPSRKMAELDPSASSQYVSALLLIGPMLPSGITLTLTDRAASRPYIEMTLAVLQQAGIETSVSANRRVYRVGECPQKPTAGKAAMTIERDWSSASYIYAAAALVPGLRIRMPGLSATNTLQGDSVAAQLFADLGVKTQELRTPYRATRSVAISGGGPAKALFEYNFTDCPDLLPAVLVTCAALGIKAKLKGVKNLRIKESDRLEALRKELTKMGGRMTIAESSVTLLPAVLHPVEPVCTHNDHRIAMAFAVLSLRYPDIVIENPETVSKSFPGFWEQLRLIRKAAEAKMGENGKE